MGVVKVHGVKFSPFSKRVELALKIKGVEYEFVDEDLGNKSPELIKYNPVHKKIPVLVHHGKPIAESLVIMEYIDEAFDGASLLPSDPYDRAQARFWAKFIDDKLVTSVRTIISTRKDEEEVKKAIKEAHEQLNYFEKEISGKKFFGGDSIGYVDVAGVVLAYWLPVLLEAAGTEAILSEEKYPAICAWSENLLACDVFKHNLPKREDMLTMFKARFQATPPK